jgi:hypothetical protein
MSEQEKEISRFPWWLGSTPTTNAVTTFRDAGGGVSMATDEITTFDMDTDTDLRIEVEMVTIDGEKEWLLIVSSDSSTHVFNLTPRDLVALASLIDQAFDKGEDER